MSGLQRIRRRAVSLGERLYQAGTTATAVSELLYPKGRDQQEADSLPVLTVQARLRTARNDKNLTVSGLAKARPSTNNNGQRSYQPLAVKHDKPDRSSPCRAWAEAAEATCASAEEVEAGSPCAAHQLAPALPYWDSADSTCPLWAC